MLDQGSRVRNRESDRTSAPLRWQGAPTQTVHEYGKEAQRCQRGGAEVLSEKNGAIAPCGTDPIPDTLLAFDYGEKRIGVAVGNTLTRQASALTVIFNRNRFYRFDAVDKLISAWQPAGAVVGLPLYPDGTPHAITQQARRFGNQLHGRFGLPVIWIDERYSSVAADEAGAKRKMRDAWAAQIILQQYFDERAAVARNQESEEADAAAPPKMLF